MSLFFSFSSFVASYSAISNFATLNLASFSLLGFNSPTLNILDAFDLRSFNSVGSSLVSFNLVNSSFAGFYLAGSDFDNKLRFANAGFFSNSPSSHLASRFFLQGPGSLSTTDYCFHLRTRPSLLLSYFKHLYFSCQVYFADNLPVFLRNLPLSNLAMSAFSNSYLHHYISFVPSLQLHYSFGNNHFILYNLQSSYLQLDSLPTACLPSTCLLEQVSVPSNLPSLSSQDLNSNGGIFFQFSLPKLRLSSFPFALYISRPSSLVPSSPNSNPLEPFDFNRSFYSQNLPSYVGLLGSFIHSSISDSTCPVGNSIDISITSIGDFTSNSDPLSTCELSSLHHFLNLRSRTASFFSFLDSFFLFDSPFLDSLPWHSFSFKQNSFCFPSLPSHLHTPSNEFSLFDEELFLANNSFFPFANQQSCLQSCLYEEHFSLQHHLFRPFNHNCSSYKQLFPLNQPHFLLGEEHFLAGNGIFTSNISFPSTSFLQLQPYPTFLASSFQVATFKSNFNASFIPNLKTSFPAFLNLHLFFDNFACSANFPHFHNFHNFFSFSHSIQLDIYHHLDNINPCPSANLHFPHFHNSFFLSDYFSYLSNLVTQNYVTFSDYFSNLTNLATHNYVTFSDYFSNSSYLMMQNDVFSSHYFYNLYHLMLLNSVTFNYYFYNYSSNFVHLPISNSLTLQHYSNYFGDFVPHHFVNLQNYSSYFVDFVHTNNFIFNYYFYNLRYLVTHNNVTSNNYFYNLRFFVTYNNVILNNYFSTLSSLVMHNNIFLSNLFCNLTFSKLHNNVFLNNYFSTLSSLVMYNNVFLSNLFCNFTYFTSLKSCSNEANLYNRSSYLSDLLAKYSVYSLHSPSFKTLLRNHTRSFYSSKLTKTPNNLSKKASSLRSHYRIKMSFEGKLPSHFAISLARNYLSKQFPNAILFASCHQNTNHTHIHVLLFARDVNGKKLHFSNSNYKKLDIGWAKLYARVFGEHKLQQHIDKKAQSRSWKKDRAMGIDRQKPHRVSVTNRQQQQLQPQFHQQFQQQQQQVQQHNQHHNQHHNQQFQQHNQQLQHYQQQHYQLQHLLNAHNNHYKHLQLAHNINHILPFKHLQLVHNIDHKQLYNQLYSNHFGTNIELNQPYNKLSNKTFDLNIVQNHHLFNTFDKHFDNFLDFNSCRFYGLSLNDGVHFNKFDSIFVAKDLSFLAQDRAYNRPFDRTYDTVFIDKLPFLADQLPSTIDKNIDKHLSVTDKNVLHFYINPVPSALSMINNSPIDKDLANHRHSINLSQLHLNQQNLIQQLQLNQHNPLHQQQNQHNFNQNLSPQNNLDHQPTNLNQQPLPQNLHQHQHNHLYNQTHLNQPINLIPLSSDTYLDLIHTLDTDYSLRVSDRVIDERKINEKVISDRELNEKVLDDRVLNERALDDTINDRDSLSRNDSNVLHKHSLATTDHNLHPIQDNGLDRNHDYDYELDLDEPDR